MPKSHGLASRSLTSLTSRLVRVSVSKQCAARYRQTRLCTWTSWPCRAHYSGNCRRSPITFRYRLPRAEPQKNRSRGNATALSSWSASASPRRNFGQRTSALQRLCCPTCRRLVLRTASCFAYGGELFASTPRGCLESRSYGALPLHCRLSVDALTYMRGRRPRISR